MISDGISFDELLALAKLGDVAAMTRLVQQYEPEVRVVARARLGHALRPHLDSLDLVQSVHRSLMVGLREDKFDISSPDKLVALAVTIVRRKVARQWRKLKRQKPLSPMEGEEGEDGGGLPYLLASISSPEQDPADAAAFEEACQQVLSELDDVERQLIQMRLDGCTTAEVARHLGLDADILRVKLGRLRRRLRDRGLLSEWL